MDDGKNSKELCMGVKAPIHGAIWSYDHRTDLVGSNQIGSHFMTDVVVVVVVGPHALTPRPDPLQPAVTTSTQAQGCEYTNTQLAHHYRCAPTDDTTTEMLRSALSRATCLTRASLLEPATRIPAGFGSRGDLTAGASLLPFSSPAGPCQHCIVKGVYAVPWAAASRSMSKHSTETDAELDARYEAYFSRSEIDAWETRKAMNDLCGMDLVPEPKIIIAALQACRRNNDFALAVRFLEAVREKCGNKQKEIYPYLLQEIGPTLQELGVNTPEELGYDKPELALASSVMTSKATLRPLYSFPRSHLDLLMK
ncbi:Cytochrome c oxidase subunit 5A, mitochondrial [Chionoecetes opilio]|uniref:Cytochrome c oxidase subunit 5A, mitochondrial n=1 Tax=Chionoecetes opilio TaxID=41210 RepID=A0A8J5BWD5_CHIOP|nr:Cytochrome c oxidase subunit 5A, mitochondrial [Chionoecetes opilio]